MFHIDFQVLHFNDVANVVFSNLTLENLTKECGVSCFAQYRKKYFGAYAECGDA